MAEIPFKVKDRVSFKPGPNSSSNVTGTVTGITEATGGRGGSSFLVAQGDDGKECKVRLGAATLATKLVTKAA